MSERAVVRISETNVYADLGLPDPEGMFVKAQLAMRIADAIRTKKLTQSKAAEMVGMTQPKLSGLLRGHVHGISETKMMECLTALGKDVKIIVSSAPKGQVGRVNVVSRRPSSTKREAL